MLCIAVFMAPSEQSLASGPTDWALFVRRDAEYDHPTTLYSIQRNGPGLWKSYNRPVMSLKGSPELLCIVEFTDSCDWPAAQLVDVIRRSQEHFKLSTY